MRCPPKIKFLIRRGGITISETRKGWSTIRRDGQNTYTDYRTTSLCTATGRDDDWSINWVDIPFLHLSVNYWSLRLKIMKVIDLPFRFLWAVRSANCFHRLKDTSAVRVRCEKVVHNAVMTLVCFPFDLLETCSLHVKAKEEPAPE